MVEAGYEFEQNISVYLTRYAADPAAAGVLERPERRHRPVLRQPLHWQFADGWKDHLDTPGSAQFGYLAKLFAGLPWFRLVPDQAHKIVTAGYGTFTSRR